MIIERILNHNSAIILDENRNEVIVMGAGLAYMKRAGSSIDPKQIEKTFVLSGRQNRSRFQEIVKEIPMEYVLLSERIISYAKSRLKYDINDVIYIILTDHIASVIGRFQEGIELTNPFLWDVKHFYPDEYSIGMQAIAIIKENYGYDLPDDEAAYIAFHFVNAQSGSSTTLAVEMTKLVREITTLVKEHLSIEYDPDSLSYYRFINHLKFFAQRMFRGKRLDDDNGDMIEIVQKNGSGPMPVPCTSNSLSKRNTDTN